MANTIRVKIEYTDGPSNYGYVSDGLGLTIKNVSLGPEDLQRMGGVIVSSDRVLLGRLQGAGFSTRVSDPASKWRAANMRTVGVGLTYARYNALADYCKRNGTTINAAIIGAIEGLISDAGK